MTLTLDKRTPETTLPLVDAGTEAKTPVLPETIIVDTLRFGTIEVETDLVITFPEGIIGFEHCTRFTVIAQGSAGSLRWLQSLDVPALAFPITEPWEFRPDYSATLSDGDTQTLKLSDTIPALVFIIVTVPPKNPQEMTANLLAPLVVNVATRKAKQVIVQEAEYTTRHRIADEMVRAKGIRVEAVSEVRAKAA